MRKNGIQTQPIASVRCFSVINRTILISITVLCCFSSASSASNASPPKYWPQALVQSSIQASSLSLSSSVLPSSQDAIERFNEEICLRVPRGGDSWLPAGRHPLGYKITKLGHEYLTYEGSMDGDIGRFLAGLKKQRRSFSSIKEQWLEIVRVAKTGQSSRIYRKLDELIAFCLKAGFID